MIALSLISVGLISLFITNHIAKKTPVGTSKYELLENIANIGFWFAFLGIMMFIWG